MNGYLRYEHLLELLVPIIYCTEIFHTTVTFLYHHPVKYYTINI